mmetsp:Transcript_1039/g.3141  ORF Transcript_1039/g.3141 Transcript_1039/m.3141 type:complete len:304 (-) Transcript_1039:736-1647(-)
MLLVHTRRVVNVRVHLSHVVKVPVRSRLLRQKLLVGVEHDVEVELLLQQLHAVVREGAHMPHRRHLHEPMQCCKELVRVSRRRKHPGGLWFPLTPDVGPTLLPHVVKDVHHPVHHMEPQGERRHIIPMKRILLQSLAWPAAADVRTGQALLHRVRLWRPHILRRNPRLEHPLLPLCQRQFQSMTYLLCLFRVRHLGRQHTIVLLVQRRILDHRPLTLQNVLRRPMSIRRILMTILVSIMMRILHVSTSIEVHAALRNPRHGPTVWCRDTPVRHSRPRHDPQIAPICGARRVHLAHLPTQTAPL